VDIPARPVKLSIRLISRGEMALAGKSSGCLLVLSSTKDLVAVTKFIYLTKVLFCCQFFVWEASQVPQCQRCIFP
jgi:hypothetical protein